MNVKHTVVVAQGVGYERWAKKFNLKSWSQTLLLLQEKGLLSEDALNQRIAELQTQYDDALMDARMDSIQELSGHLSVYRQYKPLAQKLQTVRNPAKFKEQHRAELTVYQAARAYLKANGVKTVSDLPDLDNLDAEYQTLSSEKNGFYTRYLLIPSTKAQKMLVMTGKGGEGKSRIGLLLKKLFGEASHSESILRIETNRFASAELVGVNPLHLAGARPFCRLKAPLGLSLLRCARKREPGQAGHGR